MKQGFIEILDLDFEYKLWKNDIRYYSEQIRIIEDRLIVLSREHSGWKLDEKSELIVENQKQSIQKINKAILTHEQEIAFYAVDYPITKKHTHYAVHENIRKELKKISFRQNEIISELSSTLSYPVEKTNFINL